VLATIVAVSLAYQANNGLPFVPKYHLNVQVRDATELRALIDGHLLGRLAGVTLGLKAQPPCRVRLD